MSFAAWLAEAHPDVRLAPMQAEWVALQEQCLRVLASWPRASGKTFVFGLYRKFLEADRQ